MRRAAHAVWFSFVTSVLVTIPLALVLTAYNIGFTHAFYRAYLVNSIIAVIVSTFASLAAAPLAMRIVGRPPVAATSLTGDDRSRASVPEHTA